VPGGFGVLWEQKAGLPAATAPFPKPQFQFPQMLRLESEVDGAI
jgi:hypothetical protein